MTPEETKNVREVLDKSSTLINAQHDFIEYLMNDRKPRKVRLVDAEDLAFSTAFIIFLCANNAIVSLVAFIALILMVNKGISDLKKGEEDNQGKL